ncbi:predicted protein [Botrytis cinerea T4]|uniref:Uncharacterized protein n=1 Tax=Botryotinia fuckeliana (strain T4) TaxID=999810 RepID=G2Y8E5_BOTF4|nr:predicted protein [Botrytis cinerea T4]
MKRINVVIEPCSWFNSQRSKSASPTTDLPPWRNKLSLLLNCGLQTVGYSGCFRRKRFRTTFLGPGSAALQISRRISNGSRGNG